MTTLAQKETGSPTMTTAHAAMRSKARVALDQDIEAVKINQVAVDNATANRATFQHSLEAIQAQRAVLLAELKTAQAAQALAQTAYNLSTGTPVEEARAEMLTNQKEKVSSIMADIQELASHSEETTARQKNNDYALDVATEQRDLAQEAANQSSAIWTDVDNLHCQALTAQLLEGLAAARSRRDKAQEQLALAEQKCSQAQESIAAALTEWPEYLTQILQQHAEFESPPMQKVLEMWHDLVLLVEARATEIDPQIFAMVSPRSIPLDLLQRVGSRTQAYRAGTPEAQKDYNMQGFQLSIDRLDAQIAALRTHSRRKQSEAIAHNT
jgi:hypothetical protein